MATNASDVKFEFSKPDAAAQADLQSSSERNPFNFENHANKDMFGTQI